MPHLGNAVGEIAGVWATRVSQMSEEELDGREVYAPRGYIERKALRPPGFQSGLIQGEG